MPDNSPNHTSRPVNRSVGGGVLRRILWFFCFATLAYYLFSSYEIIYQAGWHLGRVSGTVSVNGKPIGGAKVLFVPIDKGESDPKICPVSIAKTDKKGRFTLETLDGRKGAVVGRHLVFVSTREVDVSTDGENSKRERASERIPSSNSKVQPKTVVVGWFGGNQLRLDYSNGRSVRDGL